MPNKCAYASCKRTDLNYDLVERFSKSRRTITKHYCSSIHVALDMFENWGRHAAGSSKAGILRTYRTALSIMKNLVSVIEEEWDKAK